MEKQERKELRAKSERSRLLTDNRMATINKRETSLEGLVAQLENGEDGIYNLQNDSKVTIFQPKVMITKKDVEEIPELRQVREAIKRWEERLKTATGRDAFIIKQTIIELRKDQYLIKDAFRGTFRFQSVTHSGKWPIELEEDFTLDENGYVVPEGFCLADPKVCSAILCNYNVCKGASAGHFDQDLYYLMMDFDDLFEEALKDYPIYKRICEYKIDGFQNVEIQGLLQEEFKTTHSLEYISGLWRNKIPALIASLAEDKLLDWYYLNIEKGKYKKCSRCGQIKLAHNKYFSQNKTSKDGFYSICKCCRNTKNKKKKG